MPYAIVEWIEYLGQAGAVLGFPLIVVGGCFLVGGWRFGRAAAIGAYALTGLFGGLLIGRGADAELTYAIVGVLIGPTIGLLIYRYAAAVLGGFFAAMGLWAVLGSSTLPNALIYILLGVAFFSAMAGGVLNERSATVIITSLLGGILLVSGALACAAQMPHVAPHIRGMAATTRYFYPFLLVVAIVSGAMLQFSAIRRKDCGNVSV